MHGVSLPNPIGLAEPSGAGKGADPCGIRRPFRPFIEDVDDPLPDLVGGMTDVRKISWIKGLFSDTPLTEPILLSLSFIPPTRNLLSCRCNSRRRGAEAGHDLPEQHSSQRMLGGPSVRSAAGQEHRDDWELSSHVRFRNILPDRNRLSTNSAS